MYFNFIPFSIALFQRKIGPNIHGLVTYIQVSVYIEINCCG